MLDGTQQVSPRLLSCLVLQSNPLSLLTPANLFHSLLLPNSGLFLGLLYQSGNYRSGVRELLDDLIQLAADFGAS